MNRVLILRLSSLGDVVLTTSVIKTLLDSSDDAEIYFVTKKLYAPLLRSLLDDDRLLLLSEDFDVLSIRQLIKKIRPDIVFDLHNNARTQVMTFGFGNVHRVPKHRLRRMLTTRTKGPKRASTVLDDYRKLLEHTLNIPSISLPHLADRGFPIEEGRILIHPGAKWQLKQWPMSNFLSLYDGLKEKGFKPVFISDQQWKYPNYLSLKTQNINELMDEISKSSLFIGNDSGPSHIAAGLRVPSITVFGPTHPCLGFTPQGPDAQYINLGYDCSPCTLHGKGRCRLNGSTIAKCMSELSPQTVLELSLSKLKG